MSVGLVFQQHIAKEGGVMFDSLMTLFISVAAISAGLMAGVYFAFSGFIMQSFDQLGARLATDAMNAINKVILRSWFMPLFFGSTLMFAVLSVISLLNVELAGRWLLFAAGLIYVAGMFFCTLFFNVPLNNRLEKVRHDDNAKSDTWTLYLKHWTRWNHVRCVCSLVALILSVQYLVNYA